MACKIEKIPAMRGKKIIESIEGPIIGVDC